ncbi:TonB-dependent siderophore receptor [Tistrella mobilis]|uniref:TonB-dependent siderophore receptor n=1 Tax=Tistrella mobilis TaxID=171437 RepID=UPI00355736AB
MTRRHQQRRNSAGHHATGRPVAMAGAALVGAAILAGAGMGASTAAQAQGAAAVQDQQHDFDIPSQPLVGAINAFSAATGWNAGFAAGLDAGVVSPGVRGRLESEQALRRMLAGTGLTYRLTGPRAVMLEALPPAPDGATQLDPLTVDAGRQGTARGAVPGIVATHSVTASKTDTPIMLTPQAVSVVTRDQMDMQGSATVSQALRYTPGVISQYGDVDLRVDWFTVRGFTPGRYLDGLRLPFGARGYGQPRIEPYGLERIEALKGPASVLYGQNAPGGLLNMTSKRPTAETLNEIELGTGSYDRRQLAGDFSGAMDDDRRLLYRLTVLGRQADTAYDYVEEDKIFVAPAFTWAGDDTTVTILSQYQKIRSEGGGGAPALPAVGTLYPHPDGYIPTSRFVGEPDYDLFTNEQWMLGYEVEHRLDDVWTFSHSLRYADVDTDTRRVQGALLADRTLYRYAWAFPETARTVTLDTRTEATFETGPIGHDLLMGVDLQYERSRFEETDFPLVSTIDVFDPVYSGGITVPPVLTTIDQTRRQVGGYMQNVMSYGRWHLMLGGRYDHAQAKTDNDIVNKADGTHNQYTIRQNDEAFTGRAGLVYAFDNGLAPYVSYTTSFQPLGGRNDKNEPLQPTKGRQAEIGLRYQPTGFASMITVSAYHLVQQDVATSTSGAAYIQTGEVEVKGLEVEAHAELGDGYRAIASYAYSDSEITETLRETQRGKQLAFVPRNTASLWLDKSFEDGFAQGLGLGAGVRYIGHLYGDLNNDFKSPGVTLFDAGVRFDLGRLSPDAAGASLAINATNLLDERYVSTCLSATGCYWGPGRAVTAAIKYRW